MIAKYQQFPFRMLEMKALPIYFKHASFLVLPLIVFEQFMFDGHVRNLVIDFFTIVMVFTMLRL
jgi:hypothetical protein